MESRELNDTNSSRVSINSDFSFVRGISEERSEDEEERLESKELNDFSDDSDNDRGKRYP